MFIKRFVQLFTHRRKAKNGRSMPLIWIVDEHDAALVNPDSGKLYAHVWHDGCGKYYPVVVVSPWRALRLIRHHGAMLVSLRPLPRIAVELFRLKSENMDSALCYCECALGHDE